MSAQIQFWLSVALLLGSVPVLCLARKSLAGGVIYFVMAEISAGLLVVYYAADQLTGAGINDAALYHLKYGLRHAGYGAYSGLVFTGVSAGAASILLFGFAAFWRKGRQNQKAMVIACLLVGASLLANPALRDLLVHPGARGTAANFHRYYKSPDLVAVPGSKPVNLVWIYAEGFERTFFDEQRFPGLIKELRQLEAEGTSFTNITQLKGTGWTMGGIVASLCGIPLVTPAGPMGGNSMSGMDSFLPGATALSDLLKEQDYQLSFIGGANSAFAGKRDFLATHGFAEILGREELAKKLTNPALLTHWGLYDESTFEFSLKRYREMAAGKGPFGLFVLTLDTHYPNPVSPKVSSIQYGDGSNPMLNAIAASDALIGEFVREIRATPGARKTVIVIASDHLAMFNPATPRLDAGKRSNMLIVIDPLRQGGRTVSTPGTTLDLGATIIPFLGWRGALGLGRDLLDDTVAPDERRQIQSPDNQAAWEDEIMQFWEFPRIKEYLEVDPGSSRISIDGRYFKAPVLVDLSENLITRLKFEFDASAKEQMLHQFVSDHAPGDPFILVTTKQRAKSVVPAITGTGDEWGLVIGRYGQRLDWLNATESKRLTKAEIERYIAKPTQP